MFFRFEFEEKYTGSKLMNRNQKKIYIWGPIITYNKNDYEGTGKVWSIKNNLLREQIVIRVLRVGKK